MAILATINDSVRADLGWKEQMKRAIRDPLELARRLGLPPPTESQIQACKSFGLFVPEPFLQRIEPGNLNDPLLRQVLPVDEELVETLGFSNDPLAENEANEAKKTDGILQKYQGRVLLIANSICAVNCRYCFRRHFPYEQAPNSDSHWQSAIEEIASDHSIEEVIFSGGDPLTLVDEKLAPLVQQLDQIDHVSRIRFHTRLPIVIPNRVTTRFCKLLNSLRSKTIVVVHCNHANEIDQAVSESLEKIRSTDTMLLNQSVLLKGVNDTVDSLVSLSKRLIDNGVIPYYLHQLDRVQGAAHFEVPESKGHELIEKMRAQLPGYAVPRFVREEPGKPSKSILN